MYTLLQKTVSIIVIASFVMMPVRVYADPAPNALPTGGVIVGGLPEGNIDTSVAGSMTINQVNQKMIANWSTFNIGKDATVTFNQAAGRSSIALNRVADIAPSQIFGHLSANGRVFIVNPNGVLFGPDSHVDTAGLLASSLNITDTDFLSGNYNFTGEGGSVVNQGELNAPGGFVALLGSHVQNSGKILANLGFVTLASGKDVTVVSLDPLSVINVVINEATDGVLGLSADEVSHLSAVENTSTGTISAKGGKVLLTAEVIEDLFSKAINNEGVVEATKMSGQNGQIVLEAVGDDIFVSGGSLTATNISAETDAGFLADGGSLRAENDSGDASVSVNARAVDVVNGSEVTASVSGSGNALVSLVATEGDLVIDSSDILAETFDGNATVLLSASGFYDEIFGLFGGTLYIENVSTVNAIVQDQSSSGEAYDELVAEGDIVLNSGKVSASDGTGNSQVYLSAGNVGNGAIFGDADSLISADWVYLYASDNIGASDAPINTDTRNLVAESYNDPIWVSEDTEEGGYSLYGTGNIYVNNIGTVLLNVGSVDEEAVQSNNGLVSVTTQGDMVVHNVIAELGGVFLESQNGSIYAGKSRDYKTGANVIAGGYSYFSAPKGTIGVGNPGDDYDGISGQITGVVDPGETAVTGVDPAPGFDMRFGEPGGFVYYQEGSDAPIRSIWPTPRSVSDMHNPLNVNVQLIEGVPSAVPAGFIPASALTLRLGKITPPKKDDPKFLINPLSKHLRAYYEILNPYRYASFEPTQPTGFYAYHPLNEANTDAYDGIGLDPGAYEFIDGNLNYNGDVDPYKKKTQI